MQYLKISVSANQVSAFLLAILISFLLAGCSSPFSKKTPDSFKIKLVAANDINLNEEGKAAPLSIYIFELKSLDNFENSDFFTITDGSSDVLKAETKKVYEGIIIPGESRTLTLSPDKETLALGMVAAYREIDRAGWSEVWELYKKHNKKSWWRKVLPGEAIVLTVNFESLAISIDKMD